MSNKRKVEWDEVMHKADKAVKRLHAEFLDERRRIAKAITDEIRAQVFDTDVGSKVWIWNGGEFEIREVLARTLVLGSENDTLCVASQPHHYTKLEIDQVCADHTLDELTVFPSVFEGMTSDETLKLYQEMSKILDLKLTFSGIN